MLFFLCFYFLNFQSGSAAGVITDIVLFPLDTIKTRAQSKLGFFKSGGYTGLFRGVGSVALGSAPSGSHHYNIL